MKARDSKSRIPIKGDRGFKSHPLRWESFMRCFLAVDIPEHVKKNLWQVIQNIKKELTGIKWVEPHNLHITIKFLGELEDEKVLSLLEILEKRLSHSGTFTLKLKSFGFFPDIRRPRVFWVGVEDRGENLKKLWKEIENIVPKFGVSRDNRSFTPHLTLARIKRPVKIKKSSLEELKEFESSSFNVDTLVFYKSVLTSEGPIYTKIKEIKL